MYCEKYLNDMNSRRSTKETIADIDHTLFTFETKILNKINSNCHFTNTIRMRKRSSSDPKVNLNEENLFDFIYQNTNDATYFIMPNLISNFTSQPRENVTSSPRWKERRTRGTPPGSSRIKSAWSTARV